MRNNAENAGNRQTIYSYNDASMMESLNRDSSGQDPIVALFEQIMHDVKTTRKLRMHAGYSDCAYSEHSAAIADLLKDVAQAPHQNPPQVLAEPVDSKDAGEKKAKCPQEAGFTKRIADSFRQVALFALR